MTEDDVRFIQNLLGVFLGFIIVVQIIGVIGWLWAHLT